MCSIYIDKLTQLSCTIKFWHVYFSDNAQGKEWLLIMYPIYLQSEVVELEGEVTRLNSLLRQKEREVEQVSQVASKLTNERDNVADVVRQEFADR